MYTLTESVLYNFSQLIYENLGIKLDETNQEMLKARLNRLMLKHNIETYKDYFNKLTLNKDTPIWSEFVDEITTHMTSFFREDGQFKFIQENINSITQINQRILQNNEIRVWSSACSSGEEPYTIGMVLKESLPDNVKIKILASDISNGIVQKAQKGVYPQEISQNIKPLLLDKYFKFKDNQYHISDEIKNVITFRTFNLMSDFPFKNTFDMIFCRNVMIYFDNKTQSNLIGKFYNFLPKNGMLFIGSSESLAKINHNKLKYVRPSVYMR